MSDAITTGHKAPGADVVLIGGGPGGSTAATLLARQGWRVLLLERAHFPREHIGESLLPASMPILDELGALPAVQAEGFLPKWGATMVWGRDPAPWSWYFRETNARWPHAYQVWRPRFDQILLDNARAHGVDVREGHTVLDVLFEGERAVGVRYAGPDGERVARAGIVVDASGQGALLGRRLGLRRWDASFQNLAVYGYFAGAGRLPPPDETNILVEAYEDGWFWNIPLHTGVMSVGAVVDRHTGQEGIRRDGALGFLKDSIARASHTAGLMGEANLIGPPVVLKDWSYVSDRVTGDGWVLVGDAACFIDPLFSSGVHLALSAGVLAAAWVTTALRRPAMAAAAGRVYQELYYRQYDHFRAMAGLFYASNRTIESYFWEARRRLGLDEGVAPREAFIRAVAGQSPLGYERAVLERGALPEEVVGAVRAVESGRVARRGQVTSNGHDLSATVLQPAAGVRVERRPVLDQGEFVPGQVLVTPGHPEGTPVSGFVATLLALLDGRTPTATLIERLAQGRAAAQAERIAHTALETLSILYVDGAVKRADDG